MLSFVNKKPFSTVVDFLDKKNRESYETLQLSVNASQELVEVAYHTLKLQHHSEIIFCSKLDEAYRYLHNGKRNFYLMSASILLVIVCILVLLSCLIPSHDEQWKKIDVAEHQETFHNEVKQTGKYDIHYGIAHLCQDGDDYLSCVNMHVEMYNEVCAGKDLTFSAILTCDKLSSFIDETKNTYRSCGWNCTTRGDDWGWERLSLSPETETIKMSNNDRVDEVSHDAHCYNNVWGVKWGECS